jgi:hypothetical protein
MRTQSTLSVLFLSVAVATADQQDHVDNRRLRGLSGSTGCGFVPPSCCCIDGRTQCITALCERVAANNGNGLPCGGDDYYTVNVGGKSTIICMGKGKLEGKGTTDLDPNRGNEEDEETVDISTDPTDAEQKNTASLNINELRAVFEKAKKAYKQSINTDDEEALKKAVKDAKKALEAAEAEAAGSDKGPCSIENWSLEGRGEAYKCTSNNDCMYGCCSTGHIEGYCISPFINPTFSSFLGCMPEYSQCELNRVGKSSPYTDDDGGIESEYSVGIDSCKPKNPAAGGVTKCCSSSAECQDFGQECCDRVRLQCVPKLGNDDIIKRLQCLE